MSMHNLERIDASRGWLGVVLRIPDFLRAPHLDKIAKLLDAVRDAALEETVRLEVGIVLLREHVGSQENGIALARRCYPLWPQIPEQVEAIRPSGTNSARKRSQSRCPAGPETTS